MKVFAPVAQTASVCGIASYAAIKDYKIHVIDVRSAFLNSKMPDNQKLYVKQPPRVAELGKKDWIWLLLKGIYGLKQAGCIWYKELFASTLKAITIFKTEFKKHVN
jgi:hypothetical protein